MQKSQDCHLEEVKVGVLSRLMGIISSTAPKCLCSTANHHLQRSLTDATLAEANLCVLQRESLKDNPACHPCDGSVTPRAPCVMFACLFADLHPPAF